MRAGQLRHVVEIQALDVSAQDAMGNTSAAWVSKGSHRARVEPLSGKALEEARQFKDTISVRATMRYPGFDVLPTWRLVFGGRELYVSQVINVDERNRMIYVLCTEEAPVGT